MNYKLDTNYYLSTEGYVFRYRTDRYDPTTTHVELFKAGEVVHKQIAKSARYGIDHSHGQIINALEAKITMGHLDPTGLKQYV